MPPKALSPLFPQGHLSFLRTQKLCGIRQGGEEGNLKDWKLTLKSLQQAKEIICTGRDWETITFYSKTGCFVENKKLHYLHMWEAITKLVNLQYLFIFMLH